MGRSLSKSEKLQKDREARFRIIRDRYRSVDKFVSARGDLKVEYVLFGCSARTPSALARVMEGPYATWLKSNPQPKVMAGSRRRGSHGRRLPLDDERPITRPTASSVRTVSGGLPGLGRKT